MQNCNFWGQPYPFPHCAATLSQTPCGSPHHQCANDDDDDDDVMANDDNGLHTHTMHSRLGGFKKEIDGFFMIEVSIFRF